MLETVEGAQARTAARGFELLWEDVEKRCTNTDIAWTTALAAPRRFRALPPGEDVLATLVRIHMYGGSPQLSKQLEGATTRTAVVPARISELRASGYPAEPVSSTNWRFGSA